MKSIIIVFIVACSQRQQKSFTTNYLIDFIETFGLRIIPIDCVWLFCNCKSDIVMVLFVPLCSPLFAPNNAA